MQDNCLFWRSEYSSSLWVSVAQSVDRAPFFGRSKVWILLGTQGYLFFLFLFLKIKHIDVFLIKNLLPIQAFLSDDKYTFLLLISDLFHCEWLPIEEVYFCSDDLEKYNQLQYTLLSDDEDLNLNIQDIQVLLIQALVYRLLVFAYEVQIQ